jgi:hypothetical protein
MIVGKRKMGKGFLVNSLASRITRRWPWPPYDVMDPTVPKEFAGDGTSGQVIMITPEDPSATVQKHRLNAAGGDQTKIFDLSKVTRNRVYGNTSRTRFSLPGDIPVLRDQIDEMGDVRAVFIDPLMATATKTVAFNMQVRIHMIEPLQELAARKGVAIVLTTHFNKGVTFENMEDRVNGSGGILDALRVCNVVWEHPDDTQVRVLMNLTTNFLPPDPIEYVITGEPPYDSHIRYHTPLPQVTAGNMDQVQASILALMIEADGPISTQRLASFTRLSHEVVLYCVDKSEREGLVRHVGGSSYEVVEKEVAIES